MLFYIYYLIALIPYIYTHNICTVKIAFSPKYSWKMPHKSSVKERYMCSSSAQISATGSYFSVVTRGCFTTRGELPNGFKWYYTFFADEKNILHQAPIVVSQTRCRFRITAVEPIIKFLTPNTLQIPLHGYTMFVTNMDIISTVNALNCVPWDITHNNQRFSPCKGSVSPGDKQVYYPN